MIPRYYIQWFMYIDMGPTIWSLSFMIRIGSDGMTFTSFAKDPFPLKRIRSTRRRNPYLYIAGRSCAFPFTITVYLQQRLWYYYDRCLVERFYLLFLLLLLLFFIFFSTTGRHIATESPKYQKPLNLRFSQHIKCIKPFHNLKL